MKKFKKVLAAVLAMAMVLGMSVTSMAANEDNEIGTEDDRGTIKVSGIQNDEGNLTVEAYQIIEAQYDTATHRFVKYALKYNDTTGYEGIVTDIPLKEGENLDETVFTLEVVSELAEMVKTKEIAPTATAPSKDSKENTLEGGTATLNDLPVGTYLILIKGAETYVYNPLIASVYYKSDANGNTLPDGTLPLSIETTKPFAKIAQAPDVDKYIVASSSDATSSNASPSTIKGNSVNIGDTVAFRIPVTPIPNYGGKYPVFDIEDTLSSGLTYNGDLEVYKNGEKFENTNEKIYYSTDGTNDHTIKVNFVVGGKYTLNDFVGQSLEIRYSATLNDNAKINQFGNENSVVLNYSKDSIINATDSDVAKTYTYTFDIDGNVKGAETTNILTKTDGIIASNSNVKALAGAEFTLYTKNPDEVEDPSKVEYHNSHITDKDTQNTFNGKVVSDATGQLKITGLKEGIYYLKETKAPTGYSLNTQVFKIEIKEVVLNATTGKLESWRIFINDKETTSFSVNNGTLSRIDKIENGVKIPNTKLSSLPSTGGIGTTIFTLGGCAIMIIAAGLYFASRRKKNEE